MLLCSSSCQNMVETYTVILTVDLAPALVILILECLMLDSGQARWTILWFKVVLHAQFLIFINFINKISILIFLLFLVTVLWQSLKGQVLKKTMVWI